MNILPWSSLKVSCPPLTTPVRCCCFQISPLPGKFDLSITAGAALPTGANSIAGPGVQPYLQIPWSIALGDGWALNGMETNFFTPASDVKFSYQSTLVLEKEIAERSFLFVEYVGNFPSIGRNTQLINFGGGHRIDDHHQIDFHVGVGIDRNAPNYIFGVGYSFRLDGVLQPRDAALSSAASLKPDVTRR